MTRRRFVIVGGGVAGASAASTLRREGFDGEVLLVGDEPHLPYERPPLSKEWLAGTAPSPAVYPEQWYADNAVEPLTGTRVAGLDVTARRITLGDGRTVGYDAVLIATGGQARRIPGLSDVDAERVHHLRTRADSDALRARLRPGRRLVVLGGGFVGCEVAATARTLGVEVTILEMAAAPLERALGTELGGVFARIHRAAGVELRCGERVESVARNGDGLVVHTDRGTLECSTLLVAAGLVRDTEVWAAAGVPCADGVLVDAGCRTDLPGVFAAGDVAAHEHPRYGRLRVEHHDSAVRQGAVAARNMLGAGVVFDDPHWFWSDQYEHTLQSYGGVGESGLDAVVVRGRPDEASFVRFGLRGGRVVSVLGLDRGPEVMAGRRLVQSGVPVAADQLRDESVELRRLVRRPARA
ncbi:FAD-dependent oxidoreductase [Pseudonocardia acidicola]|uniref:FAD-dependent oxidoreductase n=1 Tax=Pseudonocardia acidicola TaxID=2724939 RepID=A0ABX1SA07_9PSEU|nr:FAD-dependent oxidoreductase [Pseudonocardia acidicola]